MYIQEEREREGCKERKKEKREEKFCVFPKLN